MKTLSELKTLEHAHAGRSIARFGDGELKLCFGRDAKSQCFDPALQKMLLTILEHADRNALVCLPGFNAKSPKAKLWKIYNSPPYSDLYRSDVTYGSAFITRPDSSPWIDNDGYWQRCTDLWRDRDVVLVRGSSKSFVKHELKEASSVEEIIAPRQHAFVEYATLFRRLRKEKRRVLICLGATATALSYFLGAEGVHALDLGHLGMMMRREGRFDREPFPP